MANSSSEDETDTLPERPTRIQPYQFEPARQDFERVPVFHGVCEIALTEVLATQMGVMWCSKKVSSFELYKFNPLSPHCGSIARVDRALILVPTYEKFRRDCRGLVAAMASVYIVCVFKFQALMLRSAMYTANPG